MKSSTFQLVCTVTKKHKSKDAKPQYMQQTKRRTFQRSTRQPLLYQPHKDKSFAHLYLRWAPGIGQKPSLGHVAVYFAPFQGFTVFIEKMTADQGSPCKGRGDSFRKDRPECSGHVLIIPEGVLAWPALRVTGILDPTKMLSMPRSAVRALRLPWTGREFAWLFFNTHIPSFNNWELKEHQCWSPCRVTSSHSRPNERDRQGYGQSGTADAMREQGTKRAKEAPPAGLLVLEDSEEMTSTPSLSNIPILVGKGVIRRHFSRGDWGCVPFTEPGIQALLSLVKMRKLTLTEEGRSKCCSQGRVPWGQGGESPVFSTILVLI